MQTKVKRKAVRFGITGVIVTGVHVIVATLCIEKLQILPAFANGIAFAIATIVSYLVNARWSFSSQLNRRSMLRFWSVACLGLITTMVIAELADRAGLQYFVGIGLVVLSVPLLTFPCIIYGLSAKSNARNRT